MKKCYKESRGKGRHNKKTNWTGHILGRNCLQKHITEGEIDLRIEVKVIRGRRRKQLLDDQEISCTGNCEKNHEIALVKNSL
jgi:hypothetical protein